jgi:hypothetical protein
MSWLDLALSQTNLAAKVMGVVGRLRERRWVN